FEYEHHHVECLGAGDCTPVLAPVRFEPPEVMLRVGVRDQRKAAVERFTKELAPLGTSAPPGGPGYTSGRPNGRESFAYWPALDGKTGVEPEVKMVGAEACRASES